MNTTGKSRVRYTLDKGKLRFRFTVAGNRYSFNPGLTDTPEGHAKAQEIASRIELDILSGNFDASLVKYHPDYANRVVMPKSVKKPNIYQLWLQYSQFREKQIKRTTLIKQYQPIENYLKKMKVKDVDEAIQIRNQIIADKTPEAAKRLFVQLSACCHWALNSGLIDSNPFEKMATEVKLSKSKSSDEVEIHPFSRIERDTIIEAFRVSEYYRHYYHFVRFLFFTGCRPSEAVALQWKHVKTDHILFCQSAVAGAGKPQIAEGLKTQSHRRLPINDQLNSILNAMFTDYAENNTRPNPDRLVFPSPKGTLIDFHNFRGRAWKKILSECQIEYRKPYQTRHTFITLCLESGIDAKDVAKWVGNSPEMIYQHYAGTSNRLIVPTI